MKSRNYLKHGGLFHQQLEHFSPRKEQQEIADRIERFAQEEIKSLLIEAGTGSGKTLAYLLPIILSGKKVTVSTGTKTLQDQIFYDELPRIRSVTGLNFQSALLKGRSNYLCPQRLNESLRTIKGGTRNGLLGELIRIREWSNQTFSGDISEVKDIEETSIVWHQATSTRENCLGSGCPKFNECPLYKARDKAKNSDIVVVNHHLLFSDLILKEEMTGEILPSSKIIVVDEAHQVADVVRHLYGESLNTRQIFAFVENVLREWELLGKDDRELFESAVEVKKTFIELVDNHLGIDREVGISEPGKLDARLVDNCDMSLVRLTDSLGAVRERSINLTKAFDRLLGLADLFGLLSEESAEHEGYVKWWEAKAGNLVFRSSPLSIADVLSSLIFSGQPRWVFTSATLTVNDKFDYFNEETGLGSETETLHFHSPFDISSKVKWHIPENLPLPNTPNFTDKLVLGCWPLIEANKGRTFFLCTSYKAMEIAESQLKHMKGISLLVQGRMSKKELLEEFATRQRSLLLATSSFWEGVDVRGCDLKLLIIDKLPFRSPSDPLVMNRMKMVNNRGGDGFRDYLLPQAVIGLRQGFGRLIREESDRGLFVIGDKRLNTHPYGKIFLDSLPSMKFLDSQEKTLDYLKSLNKVGVQ